MLELQEAYLNELLQLEGDLPGRLSAQGHLNSSTARYQNVIIGMGYLPKLFDQAALEYLDAVTKRTYGILDKMTQQYIKDAEYRSLFCFSPLLEQLILLPSGYDCTIPICRIDLFLNEHNGSFKFCEFNTDGTSAMNEDREVVNSLVNTPVFQSFAATHKVFAQELFDPWTETFIEIYRASDSAVEQPVVAVLDYLERAVVDEQLEFKQRFEQAGFHCLLCDVSSLEYRDGILYGNDASQLTTLTSSLLIPNSQRIDAIYRRAVTFELLRELEESQDEVLRILSGEQGNQPLRGALALLAAVVEKKVCLIGSFATQVAHSKTSFCMLHHPKTHEFLTEEECSFVAEHVPFTTWLKPELIDVDLIKNTPECWIIKPVDGYGTVGVYAGKSFDKLAWGRLIDEKLQEDYIIQEYCTQFQTPNTMPIPQDASGKALFVDLAQAEELETNGLFKSASLEPHNILTGLFCYGGKFSGIYLRAGRDALIVGFRGGLALGTLLVDYEPGNTPFIRPRALKPDN
ncbi:MAG: hypothetical protein FWE41_06170 [Coriobacteriia bacterium]|nr:hypothetical protein [Coriobacteriia bacterium]MCL2750025.1 hypothetical protein [Coriobacteriia bacterium]